MKIIIITLLCCATALACVWLLKYHQPNSTPAQHSGTAYALHEFKERDVVGMAGVSRHELFRINKATGQVWRLSETQLPTTSKGADGKTANETIAGWEEIEMFDQVWVRETARLGLFAPAATPTPSP